MTSVFKVLLLCAVSAGVGAVVALMWHGQHPHGDDFTPATLISQVREVARLQTLDVSLHKKVSFEPDPTPVGSWWGDVMRWAQIALRPMHGKVIVFAVAHMGFDLRLFNADNLRVEGSTVMLVLPPSQVQIELLPGETEVIGSNLDTAQSNELLESARQAFAHEVEHDGRLQARARAAAERALSALFLSLGFQNVYFVERLPTLPAPGAG